MEKDLSKPYHSNGKSLGLRSKEVSEVMGNIPSWISVWGSFILLFVFGVSMFLVFTIRCSQVINARSITRLEPSAGSARYFLQVSVTKPDSDKFKLGRPVMISFQGADSSIKKITIHGAYIVEKKIQGNDCLLQLSAGNGAIQVYKTMMNEVVHCQLVSDISAFEKIFGSL